MQGRHGQARQTLRLIADIPAQYPEPAEKLVDYRIDVARIQRAAGLFDEAWNTLAAGTGGLGAPPAYFSTDYAEMGLLAAAIASDRDDRVGAQAALALVDGHMRRYGRAGDFPGLEAQIGAAHARLGEVAAKK